MKVVQYQSCIMGCWISAGQYLLYNSSFFCVGTFRVNNFPLQGFDSLLQHRWFSVCLRKSGPLWSFTGIATRPAASSGVPFLSAVVVYFGHHIQTKPRMGIFFFKEVIEENKAVRKKKANDLSLVFTTKPTMLWGHLSILGKYFKSISILNASCFNYTSFQLFVQWP